MPRPTAPPSPVPPGALDGLRRRKRRSRDAAPSRKGLIIALVVGGAIVGLCLPVSVVALLLMLGHQPGSADGPGGLPGVADVQKALTGSSASPETRRMLIGSWESTEVPSGSGRRKPVVWFKEDGTVHLESPNAALARTFRSLQFVCDFELHVPDGRITYRLTANDHLELDVDLTEIGLKLGADPARAAREFRKKEALTISLSENELSITNDQGNTTKFRRLE